MPPWSWIYCNFCSCIKSWPHGPSNNYRRNWLLSACAYSSWQQDTMHLTASVCLIEWAWESKAGPRLYPEAIVTEFVNQEVVILLATQSEGRSRRSCYLVFGEHCMGVVSAISSLWVWFRRQATRFITKEVYRRRPMSVLVSYFDL